MSSLDAPTRPPYLAPIAGAPWWIAMLRLLEGTFRLRGRASRSEYWWWMLTNLAVLVVLMVVVPAVSGAAPQRLDVGPFGSLLYPGLQLFWWDRADVATTGISTVSVYAGFSWMVLLAPAAFTVAVRRLHDANFSGWWVLLNVIPQFGSIVLLVMLARGSQVRGVRFDE